MEMTSGSSSDGDGCNDHRVHDDYRIALYYCYVEVEGVEQHVDLQKDVCDELKLKGRIRVSPEGLNGVLSGCHSDLRQYQRRIEANLSMTAPMDVKYCLLRTDLSVQSQLFETISVKATREVVSLYEPTAQEMKRGNMIVKETDRNYYRRRRRNRQKHEKHLKEQQLAESSAQSGLPMSPLDRRLAQLQPSPHLTPQEWNERLTSDPNAILVDARNVYESRVGYFQAPNAGTLLTNTRKYSSLPQVLQHSQKELAGKNIYMYCTGGVRCERASVLLQALEWGDDKPAPNQIFQLDGGIQRYLEQFGSSTEASAGDECLFRGKNFVFDPRRTDPMVGRTVVGTCLLCDRTHDDYDNGNAPRDHSEARCCKCRVLVLICGSCRQTVRACGEQKGDEVIPPLYCGRDVCVDEGNSADQARLVLKKIVS